jgi:hypothetical protein
MLGDLPLFFVSDPRDTSLYGSGLDVLWVAGDGNRPSIWQGAALAPADPDPLTATGSPASEVSPLQLENGTAVAIEGFDGSTCRTTATDVLPTAGEDGIVHMLVDARTSMGTYAITTRNAPGTRGWLLYKGALNESTLYVNTDVTTSSRNMAASNTLALLSIIMDFAGGGLHYLKNGVKIGATDALAGTISGGGLGIGSHTNGLFKAKIGVLALSLINGVGLGAAWTADSYAKVLELTRRLLGAAPRMGSSPTLTRATAASWSSQGRHAHASIGAYRGGGDDGIALDATSVNEAYANCDPQATTGVSVTGGGSTPATLTAVSDAAELATVLDTDGATTVDGTRWGPNVLKLDNSAGDAPAYAYGGAATGNTTARSSQVIARQTGAGGAELGTRDASSGAFTSHVAVRAGGHYGHVVAHGITPGDTDEQLAVHAPAGTVVFFVGQGRESKPRCSRPIQNVATAATATRNQDVVALGHTPVDAQGSIELVVKPHLWSANEMGTVGLLTRVTGAPAILTAPSGTWVLALDGSTSLDSGVAPATGVAHRIRIRWVGASMSIEVRLASTDALLGRANGTYDGTLAGSGAWQLAAGASVSVRDVRCHRNGSG